MSSFSSFFGTLLFVTLFILSGVQKIQQPKGFSVLLNERYSLFHKWASPHVTLPQQLSPAFIETHADLINQITGGVIIAGSLGALIGVPGASLLLTGFLVGCNLIIHNPLLTTKREAYFHELEQFIYNLGLIGISLMLCCSTCSKKPESGKKTSETSSQNNRKHETQHKKKDNASKGHSNEKGKGSSPQGKNQKKKRD